MLRITRSSAQKDVLKLEGRLVGPWVDELTRAVCGTTGGPRGLNIDVSELTYADEEGERALALFHKAGVRFRGKGLFSEFLFKRLKIPLAPRSQDIDGGI